MLMAQEISCSTRGCILCCRNGCATSEDMLWKLDALQSFILDLHWPDEVFAEHLSHRLKLMSADMIEAAAKRYSIVYFAVCVLASKVSGVV